MDDLQSVDARFDTGLGAWILSRYADVSSALREPRLSLAGTAVDGHAAHLAVREAGAQAFSPARLAAWRADLERSALRTIAGLPAGQPVDLVRAFIGPWSLALAVTATGAPADAGERLNRLAREVFLAAAGSTDSDPLPGQRAAAAELARSFPGGEASAAVQGFVALTQTLPCFLANAWLELSRHPEETRRLRADAGLMPQAIEELLRFAGPARAVFRQALVEVSVANVRIRAGERVVLMLGAANRDPRQFTQPNRLDFSRGASGHLAFGRGPHACSGANVIRLAAGVATAALHAATDGVEVLEPVEWIGGFAIRAPATLPVILRRRPAEPASTR